MRVAPVLLVVLVAACAKGTSGGGVVDAHGGPADAPHGTPDAPFGSPDAPVGTPDAAPHNDAAPIDAGHVDAAPLGNGDTCATANDISGLATMAGGFTFNGDLTGLANDIQPSNGCTGFTNDGPDAIFIVTAQAGQTITASITTTWDAAVEITTDCTFDANCVAGTDAIAGGGTETATYTAPSAGTYYVIADSWDVSAYGPYSLTVTVQ